MKQGRSLLLFVVLAFLCAACAGHVPPALQSITGSEVITEGEAGFLRWSFANTDSVHVDGLPATFHNVDVVYVSPVRTTTYRIVGYSDGDSAVATYTIRVEPRQEPHTQAGTAEIETGGTPNQMESSSEYSPPLQESFTPSTTYAGVSRYGDRPEQIKIMRVLPVAAGQPPVFHAVLLDQYGNFLSKREALSGTIKSNCVGSFTTLSMTADIKEIEEQQRSGVSIALCADYSLQMEANLPALEDSYRQFFYTLTPKDEVSLIPFDHRAEPLLQRTAPSQALLSFAPGTPGLSNPSSLTAVYKAAYEGIRAVRKSTLPAKAVVLIAGNSENASLLYTINDVATAARAMNIPIYTIAVGMNAETYSLRYLSDYTGGRFYKVSQPTQVADILREIAYSYRTYYSMSFQASSKGMKDIIGCPGTIYTTLSLKDGMESISETRMWNIEEQEYYPYHQIATTFPTASYVVNQFYTPQLSSLAVLLKDNPGTSIELIGNDQPGANEEEAYNTALNRAQVVRDELVQLGVHTTQIRMRSAGSTIPMYYFAQQAWQQELNRRVEIRWLDPSLLPFEIVAQTVYTEQEAERLTQEWEERGQNAYYELVISQRTPGFRIKLWGYATYDNALKAKTDLQRKYKIPLSVQ